MASTYNFLETLQLKLSKRIVLGNNRVYTIQQRILFTGLAVLAMSISCMWFHMDNHKIFEQYGTRLYRNVSRPASLNSVERCSEFRAIVLKTYKQILNDSSAIARDHNAMYQSFTTAVVNIDKKSVEDQEIILKLIQLRGLKYTALLRLVVFHLSFILFGSDYNIRPGAMLDRFKLILSDLRGIIFQIDLLKLQNHRREFSRGQVIHTGYAEFQWKLDRILNQDLRLMSYEIKTEIVNIERVSTRQMYTRMNLLNMLDPETEHILGLAKSPMQYASIAFQVLIQTSAGNLIQSRRGLIIKQSGEFYFTALMCAAVGLWEINSIRKLNYMTVEQKIFYALFHLIGLLISVFVNYWLDKVCFISPRIITMIIKGCSSLLIEWEIPRSSSPFESGARIFSGVWAVLSVGAITYIYSTDLVLLTRHEQNSGLVDRTKVKLLKNIKTIMIMHLIKGQLITLLGRFVDKAKHENLRFVLQNFFGNDASIYSLVMDRRWKDLIFSTLSSNFIILLINYLVVQHIMDEMGLTMQAQHFAQNKRTLLHCRGGLQETRAELAIFNRTHNLKNTMLLLGIWNLGNLIRLPFFGSGSNILNIIEGLVCMRTEIKTELRDQKSHLLCLKYPEYYL